MARGQGSSGSRIDQLRSGWIRGVRRGEEQVYLLLDIHLTVGLSLLGLDTSETKLETGWLFVNALGLQWQAAKEWRAQQIALRPARCDP